MKFSHSLLLILGLTCCLPLTTQAEWTVTVLGTHFSPPLNTAVQQSAADMGGSTSVRNEPSNSLEFKSSGYFQRSRDLGQVFVSPTSGAVHRLIVRTGNSDAAVLSGVAGKELFVQWFEVEGDPVINDNGTPRGSESKHGFSKNHRCDDFIEGVVYRSLKIARGGTFPELPATCNVGGEPTGKNAAKLTYLEFKFDTQDRVMLQAAKRYAFLIGLVNRGVSSGFTLANSNRAADPAAVPDDLTRESAVGGWGIRREGDGNPKPTLRSQSEPEAGSDMRELMLNESMLPEGQSRFDIPPQTDGYPDVDTYRDLEFYVIQSDLNVTKVDGSPTGPLVRVEQPVPSVVDIRGSHSQEPNDQ